MHNDTLQKLKWSNAELKSHLEYLSDSQIMLEKQLHSIVTSKAYRFWNKYLKLKSKLLHLTFIKQLIPFEIKYKVRSVIRQFNNKKELRELEQYKLYTQNDNQVTDARKPITVKVSVIIPTKNAGSEFELIVKRILSQKLLKEIEIIVVDSGSTDATLKIASKFKLKVIKISPDDFSHSKSRNLGANSATGDYLVFTVQDALPLNEYTLYDCISFLNRNSISVCSARQIPRSDADLFTAWQITNFVHLISPNKQNQIIDISKGMFAKLNSSKKRSLCTLDDVFVVYKTDLFRSVAGYNEKLDYGEDLEMGKRLIEQGTKLSFLYSNGVVHSHTRNASYFLKRYFVDTLFLYTIFNESISSYQYQDMEIFELINQMYLVGSKLETDCHTQDFIKNQLHSSHVTDITIPEVQLPSFDSLLLLRTITDAKVGKRTKEPVDSLLTEMYSFISHTLKLLDTDYNLSHFSQAELLILVDKLFSIFVSGHLARYFYVQQDVSTDMEKVQSLLVAKV